MTSKYTRNTTAANSTNTTNTEPTSEALGEPIPLHVPTPPAFDSRALYGLLGEIAQTLHAHTGLDVAGLYRCLENAVGCVLGPSVTVRLGNGPPQQSHLGDVLVGETAVGKDRIYLAVLDFVMVHVDLTWRRERFFENVRSDAAIVHLVRDDVCDAAGAVKVQGVADTRTWMVEREFSRLLRDMRRPEATLSEQVRKSLDGPYLGNTTKTAALNERATNAHIAWIGLTTPTDLQENLDSSDLANGLANRFRFTYVREGEPSASGSVEDALRPLIKRLTKAVTSARQRIGAMDMTEEVERTLLLLDRGVKEHLRPQGLAGDMEARFMPQVMRAALIHARLEGETQIEAPVLVAALFNRLHVAETNRLLFAGRSGSGAADEVLRFLVRQAPAAVSLSDINREFSNNLRAGQLRSALNMLHGRGLVEGFKAPSTPGPGRRPERWRATSKALGSRGISSFPSSASSVLAELLNPAPKTTANGVVHAPEGPTTLGKLLPSVTQRGDDADDPNDGMKKQRSKRSNTEARGSSTSSAPSKRPAQRAAQQADRW